MTLLMPIPPAFLFQVSGLSSTVPMLCPFAGWLTDIPYALCKAHLHPSKLTWANCEWVKCWSVNRYPELCKGKARNDFWVSLSGYSWGNYCFLNSCGAIGMACEWCNTLMVPLGHLAGSPLLGFPLALWQEDCCLCEAQAGSTVLLRHLLTWC